MYIYICTHIFNDDYRFIQVWQVWSLPRFRLVTFSRFWGLHKDHPAIKWFQGPMAEHVFLNEEHQHWLSFYLSTSTWGLPKNTSHEQRNTGQSWSNEHALAPKLRHWADGGLKIHASHHNNSRTSRKDVVTGAYDWSADGGYIYIIIIYLIVYTNM